ncbi:MULTISPECIES: hypothetical protein [Burkholderia]|jgi:hypothetical protein|uniref:Inclusion body protein n=1 Tax=Burkholderia lata (strain ATCC 17760 / DSM 23089 / LMG 22485 / NCIMB 9086 / R18194 / 383) TaxID=482957 RepID=A0A6P2HE81_BURL3|nr:MULTISPECIES: hypothetical protein [Burkholderia]MBN3772056.1 hypothetical protein [Burkholderia sp. Se-20378]MBN3797529.1 hypothetical protein [Burkholderia sp. Ac-20392]VWB15934.1 hypothetical protein BLA6860_00577 [Burkholderia lata]VWB20525.1 hypothetical protein BLA6863_00799 [Burkholderia lata]VWM19120.1 hypothetical protein BLA6992_06934 [Burkholderia lata]
MSNTINVLVAVNTTGALEANDGQIANKGVGDFVYMADDSDTTYPAAQNYKTEGTDELLTYCQDGDTIIWRVYSISQEPSVSITGITGDVNTTFTNFQPHQITGHDGQWWTAVIHGTGTNVQYSVELKIGETNVSFDPHITAVYSDYAKR